MESLWTEAQSQNPPLSPTDLRNISFLLNKQRRAIGTFFSRIDEVFVSNDQGSHEYRDFTAEEYVSSCRPKYKSEKNVKTIKN